MGIQIQICSILRFSWSILAKCCAHLRTSSSKTQMLLLERLYFSNTDCFVRDSSCLHLTFVAFCLLSVIRKQYLKQCNYSVDQSAPLTGFRTDFTSSVWNFCRWVADVPPRETFPAAKSEEKRMFSQANKRGARSSRPWDRFRPQFGLTIRGRGEPGPHGSLSWIRHWFRFPSRF